MLMLVDDSKVRTKIQRLPAARFPGASRLPVGRPSWRLEPCAREALRGTERQWWTTRPSSGHRGQCQTPIDSQLNVIFFNNLCVSLQAWENHLRRNRSIVVDLFHGQLRSQVKCKTCGHISARFDPFNFLSLPLPMDSSMHLEITGEFKQKKHLLYIQIHQTHNPFWSAVIKLDGSTPVRYGLRLNMDEKYMGLKKQLSELCCLKPEQILLAEVHTSNIKVSQHTRYRCW